MVILNDFDAVKDALSKDSLLGRPFKGQFSVIGTSSLFMNLFFEQGYFTKVIS